MEKIIILSDTHGNTKDIIKMLPLLEEADHILFAGDGINDMNVIPQNVYKKLKAVSGNCDFFGDRELTFDIGGKKVLLTHGDRYRVKSGLMNLSLRAKEVNADIVVYGHTHSCCCEEYDGILFINPGTLYRYSAQKTFGYLVISDGKAVATINENFFNN